MSQIKIEELMIGNWIEIPYILTGLAGIGKYGQINFIDAQHNVIKLKGSALAFTPSELYEIRLTETILLNSGFNNDYKPGYIGIDVSNTDFVLTKPGYKHSPSDNFFCFQFTCGRVPMYKEMSSVHVLQNFLTAGYKETLNITLKPQ